MPRLLQDPIEINGERVSILVNSSKKGTSWFPLLISLIERLSMAQILEIIYTRPRTNEKIINYDLDIIPGRAINYSTFHNSFCKSIKK
jgi:hypothetical protein